MRTVSRYALRWTLPRLTAIGAVTTAMNAFKTAKTFMALLQSSGKITQVTNAFKAFGSAYGAAGNYHAVAAAIALLYKNWDTVKAWLVNFGNTVNQIWTNFSNMVGNAIQPPSAKNSPCCAYLQGGGRVSRRRWITSKRFFKISSTLSATYFRATGPLPGRIS